MNIKSPAGALIDHAVGQIDLAVRRAVEDAVPEFMDTLERLVTAVETLVAIMKEQA